MTSRYDLIYHPGSMDNSKIYCTSCGTWARATAALTTWNIWTGDLRLEAGEALCPKCTNSDVDNGVMVTVGEMKAMLSTISDDSVLDVRAFADNLAKLQRKKAAVHGRCVRLNLDATEKTKEST